MKSLEPIYSYLKISRYYKVKAVFNLILVIVVCYLFISQTTVQEDRNDLVGELTQSTVDNEKLGGVSAEPKVILYWTKYFNHEDLTFGFGQEPFINAGCPVNNCIATKDRSLLNESAAIMFHSQAYNESDVPLHRQAHQRYVFMLYETLPFARHWKCFSPRHFFNWTMTHRRDSDIYDPKPYGIMRRKQRELPPQLPRMLHPGEAIKSPRALLRPTFPNLNNRTKLLAWFCSNCKTDGKRELYFKELAKYIPIDIYGKCGNKECLPRNSHRCNNILNEYKFYLAAENSLCPDYVTEKFYRSLENGIVPVVYGGADYAHFAPPHSYIHIANFPSPRALAEYLLLLDRTPGLYMEYLRWREDYEVVRNPLLGWCDLCAKLHDPYLPSKSYESIVPFWYDHVPCVPGSTFLEWALPSNQSTKNDL